MSSGLRGLYRLCKAARPQLKMTGGSAKLEQYRSVWHNQMVRNLSVSGRCAGAQVSLDADRKRMVLQTESGLKEEYPWVWLRDNCQCSACFEKKSLQRIVNLAELDMTTKPTKVENDSSMVKLHWEDGHVSEYPTEWLDHRSFRPEQRNKIQVEIRPQVKLWGGEHINNYSRTDFEALMTDDKELYRWLDLIDVEGFVLVENCPKRLGPVTDLQRRIAFEKMTHYGSRYDIEVRADYPANIALTHHRIFLHTDLVYYDFMPGTAFIQCVKQHKGEGGETMLADGFYAAKILKEKYPEKYELLSNTVANFVDIGKDYLDFDKVSQQPFFTHDTNGELVRVTWSHFGRDSIFNVDIDKVDEVYDAMKIFDDILNNDPNVHIKLKMKEGDMLTMKNTRVMHGRTELKGGKSDRLLSCGYVDEDESRSKKRCLKKKIAN